MPSARWLGRSPPGFTCLVPGPRIQSAGSGPTFPPGVSFQTKPQIALDLLDRDRAWGVRFSCVTADADYGDNPNFLEGLEQRRQRYVVAVRADFAVATSRRGGEVRRADVLARAQAARSWRKVTWREGSQGWM